MKGGGCEGCPKGNEMTACGMECPPAKSCHSIIRFKLNSVRTRVVEADLLAGACRGLHDGHILRRCSIHLRIVKYSESTTPRRATLAQPPAPDSCHLCVAPPPAMGPFPRCT